MIMGFTKIVKHGPAETLGRITILYHLLKLAVIIMFTIIILLSVRLDQKLLRHNVLRTKEQDALARLAVSPGTTGLLYIGLHIFRHIKMDDISNVRFIDAHAKGVCCYHHANIIIEERLLTLLAFAIRQTCMISPCRDARVTQPLIQIIDFFSGRGIYNARLMGMLHRIFQHVFTFVLSAKDRHSQVISAKPRNKNSRIV
ncbi:hypothetical protein D3C76_680950 [compost metagenome]